MFFKLNFGSFSTRYYNLATYIKGPEISKLQRQFIQVLDLSIVGSLCKCKTSLTNNYYDVDL